MLSIQNDREWKDFCLQVLQQPELVEDRRYKHNPERYKNRVALAEIINKAFAPPMTRMSLSICWKKPALPVPA